MKTVTVRNLVIGDGAPKIIVSLMGIDIATVKAKRWPIAKRISTFWNGALTISAMSLPQMPCWKRLAPSAM